MDLAGARASAISTKSGKYKIQHIKAENIDATDDFAADKMLMMMMVILMIGVDDV